jgi:hypothetical protein
MEPSKPAIDALEQFEAESDEEKAVVRALRELVEHQEFDPEKGEVTGPRINIDAVARKAKLSTRNLISYEGCKLQRARDLVLKVQGLLKDYSLQIECDYLRQENDRLQARLKKYDSASANRVVALHRKQKRDEATSQETWSTEEVLASVNVKPMSELASQTKSHGKRTP